MTTKGIPAAAILAGGIHDHRDHPFLTPSTVRCHACDKDNSPLVRCGGSNCRMEVCRDCLTTGLCPECHREAERLERVALTPADARVAGVLLAGANVSLPAWEHDLYQRLFEACRQWQRATTTNEGARLQMISDITDEIRAAVHGPNR